MTYVKDFLYGMSVAYIVFLALALILLRYFSLV